MVGLVIVSHSARLAEGVAELMRGMAGADAQIATAGGMDLPDQPLGTDANLIQRAIDQVYSPDGVAVLVDLGSAILSTELALEMLAPEQRAHVRIVPAPLVEGGIAAAVQARLGSSLDAVIAEARTALDAKLAQLDSSLAEHPTLATPPPPPGDVPAVELVLPVNNLLGLHARPAARFVQTAARFGADVRLEDMTNGRGPVNAKSINAVTTLGVLHGHEIKITARGAGAQDALDAIQALANDNFGDVDQALKPGAPAPAVPATAAQEPAEGNEVVGLAASGGYAIGPARLYRPVLPPTPKHTIDDPGREWARLSVAIVQAQAQLEQSRRALDGRGKAAEAEIFDAQRLMLDDEALQEPARRAIRETKTNAALAFENAASRIAEQYDALDDEYQRARAADVRAVARQVLMILLGGMQDVSFRPGILVASDLTPAETAHLDPSVTHGICTALGGPTGHSAILAKSLGIPAVVGLGERILQVSEGDTLIVDGERGRVWVNPAAECIAEYEKRIAGARQAAEETRAQRNEPAITSDGHRVEIAANIGSVREAEQAVELGAEAVGLFRTEFLFLDRRDPPSEDEQYETYRAVGQAMQGRPLLIRTLDIGGDKPLPYANLAHEANPFLGLRGLRLCLARPELFKTQLRAILRVAGEFPVRVMFPMVSVTDEFRRALVLMGEARQELQARGSEVPERVETGIMVEVPSAALSARAFASEVDFFSIGTNDLTQYTLAVERGNPDVAPLADPFQSSVLQLIAMVVEAAHAHNKWVGVCGEMGGDPKAIPLLVGLGVDELSMSAPLIPRAKEIVREMNFADAQAAARGALK